MATKPPNKTDETATQAADTPATAPETDKGKRRKADPTAPRPIWVSPKAMKLVKTCSFMWNVPREEALDRILSAYGKEHGDELAKALATLLDAE
jgi:hypothetical protein